MFTNIHVVVASDVSSKIAKQMPVLFDCDILFESTNSRIDYV